MEWHDFPEVLPSEEKRYLLQDWTGCITTDLWYPEYKRWSLHRVAAVMRWMEYPEPPEVTKKEYEWRGEVLDECEDVERKTMGFE